MPDWRKLLGRAEKKASSNTNDNSDDPDLDALIARLGEIIYPKDTKRTSTSNTMEPSEQSTEIPKTRKKEIVEDKKYQESLQTILGPTISRRTADGASFLTSVVGEHCDAHGLPEYSNFVSDQDQLKKTIATTNDNIVTRKISQQVTDDTAKKDDFESWKTFFDDLERDLLQGPAVVTADKNTLIYTLEIRPGSFMDYDGGFQWNNGTLQSLVPGAYWCLPPFRPNGATATIGATSQNPI